MRHARCFALYRAWTRARVRECDKFGGPLAARCQFDTLGAGVVQSRNSISEKRRRGIVRAKAASREPAGGVSRRRERAELAPELRERTSAEAQVARVGVAAVSTAESGRAGHAATSSGVVPREKGSRPGRDESFFDLGDAPRPLTREGYVDRGAKKGGTASRALVPSGDEGLVVWYRQPSAGEQPGDGDSHPAAEGCKAEG